MLYAGLGWAGSRYEVAVLDACGEASAPAAFDPARVHDVVAHLTGIRDHAHEDLVVVIDSTNGIVDGHLTAAGLAVYRADPPAIAERRPVLGSVPAATLAALARRDLALVTRVGAGGTLTGRDADHHRGLEESAPAVAALTGAARWVSHGSRAARQVALTFDDGPNPPYTGRVLDVLERYGVVATFFCVGLNAHAYPDDVRRAVAAGHGVGNHTWSHPFLPDLSPAQLREQVERTDDAVAAAGGGPAPRFFRPPYGSRSADVVGWLARRGRPVALWDVDPCDWARPGVEAITNAVVERAAPGSIILMHDGGGDRAQTVAALPAVLDRLLDRGFSFVLLDDLVGG